MSHSASKANSKSEMESEPVNKPSVAITSTSSATTTTTAAMASPLSSMSQPLHNLAFSKLKWTTINNCTLRNYHHYNHNRFRGNELPKSIQSLQGHDAQLNDKQRGLETDDATLNSKNELELGSPEGRNDCLIDTPFKSPVPVYEASRPNPEKRMAIIDRLLAKPMEKLAVSEPFTGNSEKKMVVPDRLIENPVKKPTVSEALKDNSEKKTTGFNSLVDKPVKKRIVSEVFKENLEKKKKKLNLDPAVEMLVKTPMVSESLKADPGCSIKKPEEKPTEAMADEKLNKIYVRIRTKKKAVKEEVLNVGDDQKPAETEELAPKTWNLRPRRPPGSKPYNTNGGEKVAQGNETVAQPSQLGSDPSRDPNNAKVAEKKEKHKEDKMTKNEFLISLTKEEIEQDILAMTGSKPSKKPKKRSKMLQRKLDNCFPGLWLNSITPDSYRVNDARTRAKS